MPRRANPPATSPQLPALEALLSQASKGDREAFLKIYERTGPRILGVIERILGRSGLNEQLLEDVFVDLWKASGSLAGRNTSVAAWLTFRARHAALDRLFHASAPGPDRPDRHDAGSRRSRRLPDDGSTGMLAWLPDAEAVGRLEQRRPLLVKVLGQLPRDQFNALELVIFGGRMESEIAGQLHAPLARVKAELRAAVRFLRHRRRAVVGSWGVNI